MHWYVVESGQPTGPHDRVAIERLVALGRITAGTKVCLVGTPRGRAHRRIP